MFKMRYLKDLFSTFLILFSCANYRLLYITTMQPANRAIMFSILLITISLLSTFSYPSPTGCTPYGLRLALGRTYFDSTNIQIASIWFNTRNQCPKSYITLQKGPSIKKIYCNTNRVAFNNYSSYVHRCSLDNSYISKGQFFQYQAYGWTGNQSEPSIPFQIQNIKTHIIGQNQEVKMVVLADWGYLEKKASQYDRLDAAFDAMLKSPDQPNLVCLGGDYGYDLSTNAGKNYDNFLIMMSQYSPKWPNIFITGNHEYYTKNDLMLFTSSFQLYNLTVTNITILDLPKFQLLLFDPNKIFYNNASKTDLLDRLKTTLQNARKDKPIVVGSHYPLACSGFYTYHCTETLFYIEDFFEVMIDYNVLLYIGAHFHSYQRLYPFFKGNQFKKILPPYIFTKTSKYLVSIVEGIAGNDELIVEFYIKILNFTAAVSYGKTGYGVMKVNDSRLQYQHFKAVDWKNPTDSMVMNFKDLTMQNMDIDLQLQHEKVDSSLQVNTLKSPIQSKFGMKLLGSLWKKLKTNLQYYLQE